MNINEYNQALPATLRAAKANLDFILSNVEKLRKNDRGGKMEKAAREFYDKLNRGETLTPNMFSYIDAIYERVMENAGFGGVRTLHKGKGRRALRYG